MGKLVYTMITSLDGYIEDSNTRIIRDQAVEEVLKLKKEYTGSLSLSGPTLAETCIRHSLVDEYVLYVNPIVLGSGRPIFPPNLEIPLDLLKDQTFGCGVTRLQYVPRNQKVM